MYREHTIGIVVPAYNEEGYVGNVIDTFPDFVDRAYVIDDASTDDTWTEIQEHAAAYNETHTSGAAGFDDVVVPIQHEENRGVGGGIKTGYLAALDEDIDVVTVMGGDGQMDPNVLTKFIDPIVDDVADYTKGNRFMRTEDLDAMPQFRLVGNSVLSLLTKIASGYWKIADPQNGYTAISKEALQQAPIEDMYEYYGYCNDLLVKLNAENLRVADIAHSADSVYDDEDWKSHIEYDEYIPRVSFMLLRNFIWRLNRKYLLTDFNPVALLYYFGAGVSAVSLGGILTSLRNRKESSGSWTLSLFLGIALLLFAMVFDMEANSDKEVLIDDQAVAGDMTTDSVGVDASAESGVSDTATADDD
ncbi:glycosyltransferase family 2 protein [Halogranum rubrum]|uniref:Glycosyl transferase family 2 n=1 Tax=Halogranum salarium B-1 TaxID=1210908 RepID=J3JD57_9EURY|nr:glycosyltransferase family 2 protein [Halogranum salarium]EJN57199.1 glycosyl transferase family 2 [Halogranum salarium B-1]